MEIIKKVLDLYFEFVQKKGGNILPKEWIPIKMVGADVDDDYSKWLAISSTVSKKDIVELENYWKHPVPPSFEQFLSYRHYLELELGINGVRFFPNKPQTMTADFKEETISTNPDLISRNYLPFAIMGDYEILCFNANKKSVNSELPIVSFDLEEDFENPHFFADSFEVMFIEFEDHLNQWINNTKGKS